MSAYAVRFGITLLIFSLVFSAFAYLWQNPALLETDGTIVASSVAPQMRRSAARNLKYEYSADRKHYTGESYVRYATQYDSSFSVGAPIHVYFERRNPAVSYIVRPSRLPFVIGGVIFGALGVVVIAFSWTR